MKNNDMRLFFPIALLSLVALFVACSDRKVNNNAGMSTAAAGGAKTPFEEHCVSCHGPTAEAFLQRQWKDGNSRLDFMRAMREGVAGVSKHSFKDKLSENQIFEIADYLIKIQEKQKDKIILDEALTSNRFSSEGMRLRLDTVLRGLESPWGMVFLPNNDLIFTEKGGTIWRLDTKGRKTEIKGAPKVSSDGQGGLLDVELHPRFSENKLIYFTYSKIKPGGGNEFTTAVLRARLEGDQLADARDIFVAEPYASTRHHYGSRMEFGPDGLLYVSVGERGKENVFPQDLKTAPGKIHRITDDGSIPKDNPFLNTPGAVPSVWSYGHRNPQGLAFQPGSSTLWEHEHGPRGGDELNIIQKAANYGWPVVSYGTHYDGRSFTDKTKSEGILEPINYWVPSIAPCGMAFVTGDRYPGWKGNLMVGSLRFRYLNRCVLENNKVVKQELLLKNIGRVRCVAMSRDGYLYVSVEEPGYIFRLAVE